MAAHISYEKGFPNSLTALEAALTTVTLYSQTNLSRQQHQGLGSLACAERLQNKQL